MAIDKLPPGFHNNPVSNNKYPQKSGSAAASGTPAPVSGRDEVTLTPEARQLNRMQQSLSAGTGADNSARLEAIKKAINEGSYTVNADRLAGNIISLERDIESLY
ncbi:flagellar biosynthesis anti-sigma factor FlgM [Oceanimonas baumannii]|uniref:Negative regulator of flagellin synthesis n=1 Tax=Oceanimonas baumannii TaxID=129578 RepID=A0A235CMS3_9GAMM|nr:flagellar biosynthesis anti-sigma factor FlgM [Oceanimonas baumannii]OYD25871.1 flagellar biosynthesis anti-sigma factor FlgM [Oceanimonas baumannii]TDW60113.1 FlgM family anti-sigma-28 factor [Oceanimonas baumannii]